MKKFSIDDNIVLGRGGDRMAFADKKAAFAYVNEYQKEKYDRITVMAGKGKKAEYQAAAKAAGMSLSAFIEMCVDEKISKKIV